MIERLDEASVLHHGDVFDELGHHGKIVRDEEIGQAALAPEPAQQLDQLRLRQDVERRGRLVEQKEARLEHERARDRDALALAAGKLMRIAEAELRIEPDRSERRRDPPRGIVEAVHERRLGERARHGLARMERARRVLEYELHDAATRADIERRKRRAVDRESAARQRLEPGQRAQQGRFARPRLPDNAERAARRDRERHAAYNLAPAEPHGDVLRLDHGASTGRAASRRLV